MDTFNWNHHVNYLYCFTLFYLCEDTLVDILSHLEFIVKHICRVASETVTCIVQVRLFAAFRAFNDALKAVVMNT